MSDESSFCVWEALWFATKCLFGAGCLYLLYFVIKIELRKQELQRQGVVFLPYFPILSDFLRVIYQSMKDPSRFPFSPMAKRALGTDTLPEKIGICLFGMPLVMFTSSSCLDEIYTTKNVYHSKHELER